ncbi:alpha/beta fold hydrolase [Rhizobium alvei]|uniref:Alpha/beta hydrolase n=1 Tax=Rhizobium alvei TaxID=1132659 RepID=A0ABT8YGP8_9HYPH|nr:alpha/beta fold hydrolase [Rhizobium alvei]MDO6962854.1 alpha/beta hydrolase [Rhizobium alvei]
MNIVILPGLDGTGKLLSEAGELLSPAHMVSIVRYPADLSRYEDLLPWVENTLPEDDFLIVAESFSGPLAIMLASRKPIGLKGLVFVATFARTPVALPAFLTYAVERMPIKSRALTWLAQPFLMGRWSGKEFTATFRQAMTFVPAATIARRLREVLKVDTLEKLHQLDVPFIYLLATNDRLVPSRMSLDFDRAPGAIIAIEGPHFLLQANAPDCARHILSFAARFN